MAVVGPFGGAAESQISLDSAISPFEGAPGSASDGHGVGVAAGAGGEGNSIFDLGFEPVEEAPPFKPAFLAPEALTKPETLLPLLDRVLGAKSETLFDVGLEPNGVTMNLTADEYDRMVAALGKVAELRGADVTQLRRNVSEDGVTGLFLIRRRAGVEDLAEVRVAVVGNVDAGKSTMLGVLTKGVLDDGRGLARQALFRHKHEAESGRTSSVSYEIMGFNSQGAVAHEVLGASHRLTWNDICENSSKIVSFIDLAGHERYLKTTVFGMTACLPDYVMLMVGANHGVIGMTREHLGLALALNVPVFIVITKVDMCPANILQETIKQLIKLLKSPGCRKTVHFIESMDDVFECASSLAREKICPIFQVSNVTGQSLDMLKRFLDLLPVYRAFDPAAPTEFHVEDIFSVPGVGTVVSGTMVMGTVQINDTLQLGPDSLGQFTPVQVKSIHRRRCNVSHAVAGQSACFALKKIKRTQVRKGMVMLSKDALRPACREFEAEMLVLFHSTTISSRYQAMVHCNNIRQTAAIVSIEAGRTCLRTGDRAIVRFRFIKTPEFIKVGDRLLFREGRTKGLGRVTAVFPVGSPDERPGVLDRPRGRNGSGGAGPSNATSAATTTATGDSASPSGAASPTKS